MSDSLSQISSLTAQSDQNLDRIIHTLQARNILYEYEFGIYQDGFLIRHYVPVRHWSAGLLYDTITNTVLENRGNSDLGVEPDV